MRKRNLLLIIAAVLVMLLALITSVNILPAPPTAPTPTWRRPASYPPPHYPTVKG